MQKETPRLGVESREEDELTTGRSSLMETVRSDWETPRIERKVKRLLEEKESILARIAEVDEALIETRNTRRPMYR